MTPSRSTFVFVFTMTLAAVFLIVTGLIGYYPPAHLSLDAATWRRGEWTGEIIISQVALGVVFLALAAVVAVRVNRRLAQGR
jgi:hydroxymethylglutaryl-CoA reductase